MKLCILLLALAQLICWSEGQLKIRNKKCTFPFTYNGVRYDYCTPDENGKLWCAFDAVYQKNRYTECLPSLCTFPFEYNGVTYPTCAKDATDGKYWCSYDKIYNKRYTTCDGFMGPYEETEAEVKVVCLDSNKKEHQVGDKWEDKCSTFECTKQGGKIVQSKCQGKTKCFEVGAKNYACEHEGETFDSCSCIRKGTKVINVIEMEPEKPTGCVELDMVHLIGTKWTVNCVTYQCNEDGKISIIQSKCQGQKGCYSLGQSGYPCVEKNKLYKVCTCSGRGNDARNLIDQDSLYNEEDDMNCKTNDGTQYKIGQRWTSQCAQYVCEKGGKVTLLSAKCQDRDGNCMDLGATLYKCDYKGKRFDECTCRGDNKNPYSEGVTPEGAKDVKITQVKLCYDTQGNVAERWKDGCTEFACVKGESKVVKQRCRDDADKCYDVNTKDFPCTMYNRVWKKCACELSGDGPSLNAANG